MHILREIRLCGLLAPCLSLQIEEAAVGIAQRHCRAMRVSRDLLYRVPPLRGLTRGTGAGNGSFLLAKAAAKRVCPPLEQTRRRVPERGDTYASAPEGVRTASVSCARGASAGRACSAYSEATKDRGGEEASKVVSTLSFPSRTGRLFLTSSRSDSSISRTA